MDRNARIGSTRDRAVRRQVAHPRHAHEPRRAVDFRGTGSALAGLAVPAYGEVVRRIGLNLMDRVEHDHSLGDLRRVIPVAALVLGAVLAPDPELCRGHLSPSPRPVWSVRRSSAPPGPLRPPSRRQGPSRPACSPCRSVRPSAGSRHGTGAPRLSRRIRPGPRHSLGHDHQVVQVQGGVPARVVLPVTGRRHGLRPFGQRPDLLDRFLEFGLDPDDAHLLLHQILKRVLNLVPGPRRPRARAAEAPP